MSQCCPVCDCRVFYELVSSDHIWIAIVCDECGYTIKFDLC